MRGRLGRQLVVVTVVATLLGAVAPGTASAKKNRVIATVNGKRHKWKGRYVLANSNQSGATIIAAAHGRIDGARTKPAELLVVNPLGITVSEQAR